MPDLVGEMLLSPLLLCCNKTGEEEEVKVVQLSCGDLDGRPPPHLLAVQAEDLEGLAPPRPAGVRGSPITPRERDFQERVRLPRMRRYPVPPGHSSEEPEEELRQALLTTYRDFVLDLHKGVYMTQLTSSQEYSDIHCQLMEDVQTLKVDQGSGCIIEFPLAAVSKVYRIVKNDDKWFGAQLSASSPLPLSSTEHIVVVEFMRRKLAFVFGEVTGAQRFLLCMELLIRLAQEHGRGGAAAVSPGQDRRGRNEANTGEIAPMFSSQGPKSPGERLGKPLQPEGAFPGVAMDQAEPRFCACRPESPI